MRASTLAESTATYMGSNMLTCAFSNETRQGEGRRQDRASKHDAQKRTTPSSILCDNRKECSVAALLRGNLNEVEQGLINNSSHYKQPDFRYQFRRKWGVWRKHFNYNNPSVTVVSTSIILVFNKIQGS